MTASLHKLGAGRDAGLYYTNDSARESNPSRRDEYYTRDGGGIWWSTGETIVRHGAAVHRDTFRDLCAGIHPGTGQPLVRGAGEGHQAGLDITQSAPKSVSVLWAAGTPEQRAAIEAAHREAVDDALTFLIDEELVAVRVGAGGSERLKPSDVIVAQFHHFTSRGGDPQIHTHNVLMNVAGSPRTSDRYRSAHLTTETSRVFDYKLVLGAAYRASLAWRLAPLGFSTRPAGQNQLEIGGIPEPVLAAFSKRSQAIESHAGPNATAAQRAIATLATRGSKEALPTGPELEQRWRDELAALAAEPWAMAATLAHDEAREDQRRRMRDLDPPEVPGDGPVARGASSLFRHENVLDRKALLERSLVEASLQGRNIEAVRSELAELEADGNLIWLSDARLDERWTTPALAAAEAALLRASDRMDEREWVRPKALEQALASASHLSEEQREAVRHATGRDGVSVIEAGAGTGKTTLSVALVDAARLSGMKVIGLAPSWVAADELSTATKIDAFAIAKWRHDQAQGESPPLDSATMIIVDEVGMAGTRDLSAVLEAAQGAGAKVVLVGDRAQLASVAGASAFRAVVDVVGRHATLREVRRQETPWQQAASVLMARGDVDAGLRAYARNARIELVAGQAAARSRVVECWREERTRYGGDVLILTRRNEDASELNKRAREVLRAEGELTGDEATLMAIDRTDKVRPLTLASGERIRFGETLSHLGIRNGTRAQITEIGPDLTGALRLRVRLEDGRTVEGAWSEFARQNQGRKRSDPPRISLGYAGTVHSAQGRTAAASILYVAKATDAREVYVGMTRHRQDATVIVESARLQASVRIRRADPRASPSPSEMLERLYLEARTYREKSNVADFVADRTRFVRTGAFVQHGSEPSSLRRAFTAGRGLRRILTTLYDASRIRLYEMARLIDEVERVVPHKAARLIETFRERLRSREPAREASRTGPDLSR